MALTDNTARQLQKLLTAVATLTDEVTDLKREINILKVEVAEAKDIVDAWQAVKTGGKFIKWLASIGSGVAGAWLFFKGYGVAALK
jgi:hypothetical protein